MLCQNIFPQNELQGRLRPLRNIGFTTKRDKRQWPFYRNTGYIRSANRRRACSVAVEVDWHENGLHCFGPVERLLSDNMNHFDDLSEVVDISPSGQCRKRVLQPSAPNDAMLVAKWARTPVEIKFRPKHVNTTLKMAISVRLKSWVTLIARLAVAIVNILNMLCSLANIVICCTKMAG